MELATIFGLIATGLGVIGGAAYIYDTYRRKTLPHRFAWFIFLLISIISFASQAALGAEASLFYGDCLLLTTSLSGPSHYARVAGMVATPPTISLGSVSP